MPRTARISTKKSIVVRIYESYGRIGCARCGRFTRLQWVGASIVLGFFLGFVDTLMIGALLGNSISRCRLMSGSPPPVQGIFFSGMIVGKLAPREIVWEAPAGIFVCVILLMLGLEGLRGQGVLWFLFHYVIIPGVAVGVCHLGLWVARRKSKAQTAPARTHWQLKLFEAYSGKIKV